VTLAARRRGVEFVEGKFVEALRGEMGIAGVRLDDGQVLKADLYVDASGFESILVGEGLKVPYQSFSPALLCDKAIVGTWPRSGEAIGPHTSVRATDGGWCWQTEHETVIACGHAFSSAHLKEEDAERQLRALYPKAASIRVLKLKQGRYENCWVDNVIAIGSAAAFVEPLASAGPAVLAFACQWMAQSLVDGDRVVRPTIRKQFNKRWRRLVETERDFLSLFYKYNNRSEPFWSESREKAQLGDLEPVVKLYHELGPDSLHRHTLLHENDPLGLEAYFSVMVGQKAPWDIPFEPTQEDREVWQKVQETWRRKAESALTIEETLRMMMSAGPGPAQRPMGRAMQPVA